MSAAEEVAAAKARPCRCGKGHTFGEHIEETIGEHIGVLNRLEPHLGCVVCRQPLNSDGRCSRCETPVSDKDVEDA